MRTANAVRVLTRDFPSLLFIVLTAGGVAPLITNSGIKISGVWFHRKLGTANSVVSMGMAGGRMLGSLLGASVLSPALAAGATPPLANMLAGIAPGVPFKF